VIWKCECGEVFPELGDRRGFGTAVSHKRKTGHRILGLFDDKGDKLVTGLSASRAIALGLLKPKEKKAPADDSDPRTATLAPGKLIVRPFTGEVSPEILVLYEIAQARFPRYKSASLKQFVHDVAFGFFADHREELGVAELFRPAKPC